MPELSLIVPVYNEEENLPLLMEAICVSMQSLNREWEVIFVDDGSTDHSREVLERLVETNPEHVRVVIFRWGPLGLLQARVRACSERTRAGA